MSNSRDARLAQALRDRGINSTGVLTVLDSNFWAKAARCNIIV